MKILIVTFAMTTVFCAIGWLSSYFEKMRLKEELELIDKALEEDF